MCPPRVRDTYTHLAVWTNAQTEPLLECSILRSEKWHDSGALLAEKAVKFGG